MSNVFKTTLLLTVMTLLLMLAGRAFGGQNGMLMALAFAAVMNFVAYFFSDKIALATYRAQPVSREDLPRVYNIVERLAQKVSLPMPKVYLIPTDSPNAFATGRNPNHASVAVTQGILGLLNDDELEGVLAHELGHVRNRDILISSIAATLAGAITWLASIARWGMIFGGMRGSRDDRGGGGGIAAIAMIFLAPFAAMLIQLAVSRSREYGADDTRATGPVILRPGQRPGEDRRLFQTAPAPSEPIDRASFHHCAVLRRDEFRQPVLDPSPNRETNRAVDRKAGGVFQQVFPDKDEPRTYSGNLYSRS